MRMNSFYRSGFVACGLTSLTPKVTDSTNWFCAEFRTGGANAFSSHHGGYLHGRMYNQ